ncbi:MAG: 2-oxoacid:acceptor oxidoreductase family protein [Gaiella sp.]|nr:2-oxoacid:acceptor oxidoreductase family protein [Gaiella sp.]
MFDTRIHGRGGQGVVTAAELLSVAAFREGRYALAFPTFGSERTGAPVTAFCRIGERPIRSREPIVEPDALIVQDPTLLQQVDVFGGVGTDAYVLINTGKSLDELGLAGYARRFEPGRIVTVPASELAREHLGRPLPNAALLGGFAALTGVVAVESVVEAIRRRFAGATAEGNVAAALAAAAAVHERGAVHA